MAYVSPSLGSMAFWRPGTAAPGDASASQHTDRATAAAVDARDIDDDDSVAAAAVAAARASLAVSELARLPLAQQRLRLPIHQHRRQLLWLLHQHTVVVLLGATGSGKTTQVPQFLYQSGWAPAGCAIAVTQPRRVAATSVAARVAEEMGVPLGTRVGYAVRFDERADPQETRIKFVTDGVLVRELMLDPLLSKYSVVMLDEAHERSLATDLLLGLLRKVLRRRPDLRLVISSATANVEQFCRFFQRHTSAPVPVLDVQGRTHPVVVAHAAAAVADYREAAVSCVLAIHARQAPGDILVFLPGQDDIEAVVVSVREREPRRQTSSLTGAVHMLRVLPLYAGLSAEAQQRVFRREKRGVRKVIVATNIAETSITLPGVVYVVDSGLAKIRAFDPRTGSAALVVAPISQSSAKQRAGRAGRTQAGKAFRLYTEAGFRSLAKDTPPEILRSDLAPLLLQLKALGIDNVMRFPFLSPPPSALVQHALQQLFALQVLDRAAALTSPIGMRLSELPLPPMLGAVLLAGERYGCVDEAAAVVALLSVPSVWSHAGGAGSHRRIDRAKHAFAVYEGDHISLLNIWRGFAAAKNEADWCARHMLSRPALTRVRSTRAQLLGYLGRFGIARSSAGLDSVPVRKAIAAGFFQHAARYNGDGSYSPVREPSQRLMLHPSSMVYKVPPRWIVYHDVMRTAEPFLRHVVAIEQAWLIDVAPHYFATREQVLAAPVPRTAASPGPRDQHDDAPVIVTDVSMDISDEVDGAASAPVGAAMSHRRRADRPVAVFGRAAKRRRAGL